MDNNSQQNSVLTTAIRFIALIIGMFILGNIIGSLTNIKRVNNFETVNNQTTVTDSAVITTLPTTTVSSTTNITTTQPTTAVTTTAVTTTKDTTIDSKEEIVKLFNKSANNVKKNAKKVIRNYENLSFDEKKSDIPVPLYISGKSLIDSWLVNHDTPIEYAQADLIKENFPVKGKDWSSKLTASDVANAEIKEENGRYHIVLELADCKDPTENKGVCAVMEEVNTQKVRELADIVRSCETEYYDCRIECTIEKSTGNLVYAKYTQPMILNLTAGRITEMEATFAMSIESEFEIAY